MQIRHLPALLALLLPATSLMALQEMIPLKIAPTGHATVTVHIDALGQHDFVLDTGAEGTAVYRKFADELGLRESGEKETLIGQSGETDLSLAPLPPLSLGSIKADSIAAVILPDRADGVALAGVIGLDVFGDYLLDFDLPRMRVAYYTSGVLLPGIDKLDPLHAEITTGNLLMIDVKLDDVEAVAVLDTGARKTRINWLLGKKLGLDPETLERGETIQGATNTPLDTSSALVNSVTLGSQQLLNAPVLVADLPVFAAFGVDQQPAVILGLDWLLNTRMVIDFPGRKVWFLSAR
ncbi:MAG: aspartyl protease family protein [Pseudomonadales bacterium]|nr:aspartyl protease family protein [Pseudomonadales bacterium]